MSGAGLRVGELFHVHDVAEVPTDLSFARVRIHQPRYAEHLCWTGRTSLASRSDAGKPFERLLMADGLPVESQTPPGGRNWSQETPASGGRYRDDCSVRQRLARRLRCAHRFFPGWCHWNDTRSPSEMPSISAASA